MKPKLKRILEYASGIIILAVLSLMINHVFIKSKSKEPSVQKPIQLVKVHYIDVGQGDSILIEADKHTMLIDAGDRSKGKVVTDYLRAHHITMLDYVIATHPHIDHIGGLAFVLRSFYVKHLIMPDVTNSTETFHNLLQTINQEKINLIKAKAGNQFNLGMASFTILSPISDNYENMNNYSLVIKLNYGNTSFLFTGDAQKHAEKDMIKANINLASDVLKIGHHGASDSNSIDFLDVVNPTYAIISVGINNYGIPDHEVLQALVDRKINIYRTDKQGTVVVTSDGNTISINKNPYRITQADINDR